MKDKVTTYKSAQELAIKILRSLMDEDFMPDNVALVSSALMVAAAASLKQIGDEHSEVDASAIGRTFQQIYLDVTSGPGVTEH